MQLTAVRDLALSVAEVGAHLAAERLRPVRLGHDPSIVPTSAATVTPEWLSAVLCREVPGARVLDVALDEGHNGTSARQALTVTYNDAGHRAGLPRSLFSKATSTFTSRLLMGVTGITEGEAIFYNDIRPTLDVRSPRAFYAAADPRSRRSLVLLEDMRPQGVTFPAPMTNDLTRDDAAEMALQMATYHGALWNSPRFDGDLKRLRPSLPWQENLNRIDYVRRTLVGLDRARDVVPERIHARRHELQPKFMAALRLHDHAPQTLLHQDTHLGNWLRDADGRMGLYDWQCVSRGLWALDYSYAISVALPIDRRRAWEKDLLRIYLDGLRAAGVDDPPSFDQAWLAYRQQPLHALTLAFFSIGGSRFENALQPMGYMLWAIERIATMVDDMDTLDALDTSTTSRRRAD